MEEKYGTKPIPISKNGVIRYLGKGGLEGKGVGSPDIGEPRNYLGGCVPYPG